MSPLIDHNDKLSGSQVSRAGTSDGSVGELTSRPLVQAWVLICNVGGSQARQFAQAVHSLMPLHQSVIFREHIDPCTESCAQTWTVFLAFGRLSNLLVLRLLSPQSISGILARLALAGHSFVWSSGARLPFLICV